ncbi:MAG: hypothetical protein NVSMB69_02690 [Novosphingobium sp.]
MALTIEDLDMRKMIISAIFIAGVTAYSPLHAQDSSRTIGLAGLDLHSSEGQQALHSRIRAAVKAVCAADDIIDAATMAAQARCRKTATIAADRQLASAIANYRATALAANAN